MIERVQDNIYRFNLFPEGAKLLLGVSGGVDSMVLLHVLRLLGYAVHVAHVNYRMRGAGSDGDEVLVKGYCRRYNIPFYLHRVDDAFLEKSQGISFQAHARKERYAFFEAMADGHGVKHIVVAHHLDDQAETVLMHLMRGSGIEGLAGMAARREIRSGLHLVRPLLECSRAEIETYAREEGVEWREDASNAENKYLRNRVRLELLASIRSTFGEGAVRNIARSAAYLQGYVKSTFRPELASRFEVAGLPDNGLSIEELEKQPAVWRERLILEALHRWLPAAEASLNSARAISKLIPAQVGRRILLNPGVVWRDREALRFVLRVEVPKDEEEEFLVQGEGLVEFGGYELVLRILLVSNFSSFKTSPDELLADAEKIVFPLLIRRWREGDVFTPFGLKGRKKVSDFLTDIKVPPQDRKNVWVMESDGEIVWVIGHRCSESVRVDAHTSKILQCRLSRR